MDFELSETHQLLADSARRFLRDELPFDERMRIATSRAGFSRQLWKRGADLGLLAALFDEDHGGLGGSGNDIALIFQAIGQVLAPQPFLESLIAGRIVAASTASEDILPSVIAGDLLLSPALYERHTRYELGQVTTFAEMSSDGWRLSGEKAVVRFARQSALLIVPALTVGDELGLFLVPPDQLGVTVRDYPLIDGGRGGEVVLRDVALEREARLEFERPALEVIESAVAAGIVGLCAEAVGIMDFVRDATVDYLRTRVQFGQPIGTFQALQHRMATLAIEIEQARSAMINAASRLADNPSLRTPPIAAAKFTIDRVSTIVSEEAIQLHGAIGMTWDFPIGHYAKRLIMIGHSHGDEDHHLDQYIAARQVTKVSGHAFDEA